MKRICIILLIVMLTPVYGQQTFGKREKAKYRVPGGSWQDVYIEVRERDPDRHKIRTFASVSGPSVSPGRVDRPVKPDSPLPIQLDPSWDITGQTEKTSMLKKNTLVSILLAGAGSALSFLSKRKDIPIAVGGGIAFATAVIPLLQPFSRAQRGNLVYELKFSESGQSKFNDAINAIKEEKKSNQ